MTREEVIALYGKENRLTEDTPSYVKSYERFYLLEKLISNYILEALSVVEKINNELDINIASGDMLTKMCRRMGIEVDIPKLDDGNIDQETYEKRLRLAIIAQNTKRRSKGNRKELMDALNALSYVVNYNIKDFSTAEGDKQTLVSVLIVTDSEDKAIYPNLLYNQLFPNVTGVPFNSNYIKSGEAIFSYVSGNEDYDNDRDTYVSRGYYVAGWGTGGDAPVSRDPLSDYNEDGTLKEEVKEKYRQGGHWVITKID